MRHELVELLCFSTSAEASIVRGTLEAAGIPSVLQGETVAGWFWHLDAATGGVRVFVRREHLEEAREILASDDVEFSATADANDDSDDQHEVDQPEDRLDDLARAWRASIIGIFFFPPVLNVYSSFLLIRRNVLFHDQTRENWRGPSALLINGLVILWVVIFLCAVFRPPKQEFQVFHPPKDSSTPVSVPIYEKRNIRFPLFP